MRLRGVGRRYGLAGPWVLRGVDLDVPPGSLTRVEGTNGSGKSTLLRLLAGIDAPTSGRITDRPRTAYVPERFPAELPFSVLGYLTHLGRVHGLGRAEAVRGAGEWLERFGAAEYAATPLAELSKGTSQKVAVAQALLAAPALLVLDEAWTGLDRAARGVLDEAVAERIADGAAVVFVDHDPRRLAGSPDAVFRITETRLEPSPAPAPAPVPASVPATGPLLNPGKPPATAVRRVRIEAEPPPGATLPPNLPGTPLYEPAPPPGRPGGEATRAGQTPQSAPGKERAGPAAQPVRAGQSVPGRDDEAGPGAGPGEAAHPAPPDPGGEARPAAEPDRAGEAARATQGTPNPTDEAGPGAQSGQAGLPAPGLGGEAARAGQPGPGPGGQAARSASNPRDVAGPGARPGPGGQTVLGGDPGLVRLTVGGADSDALLRVLLTASPPWHIRAVTEISADPEAA